MKMIVALLLGCLPLGLLTVGSFLPAGQDQKVAPVPKVDDAALRALAGQRRTDAGKAAEYLQRVEQADLFSVREVTPDVALLEPLTPAGKKWFGAVYQSWSNAQSAHDCVVGFVALFHPKPISDKRKLLAELKKFASRTGGPNPMRGDSLFIDYVNSLCDEIEPQIAADEHLSKAHDFFTQKDYVRCLEELESVNRAKLDPMQLDKVVKMERPAKFWQHWKAEPSESDVERLKSHLQSSPAAVLPDELMKIEQVKRALALAECQQEFKQLHDQPPTDARDYLRRAAALVQNKAAPPDFRLKLSIQFSKWVMSKLPVRDSGITATNVEETVKSNDKPLAGVFISAGDPKTPWWKYWKTPSNLKRLGKDTFEDMHYLQHLKGPPRQPLCLRHADEFNEGREKLLTNWKSKAEWSMFAALCQRLQREWKQYQDQGGLAEFERAAEMKPRDLEIEAALAVANEVLGEWSSVAVLIGE